MLRRKNCNMVTSCITHHHHDHIIQTIYHSTDALSVSVDSTTSTSVTISWTLFGGVTATSDYTISYSNTNNTQCFTTTNSYTTALTATMYELTGLQEGTQYSITVTVMLSDGGTGSDTTTATTLAAG